MKILVTGAAGFIGFHLSERLLKDSHDVVGLDSINDYYDVNLKFGRLQCLGIKKEAIEYGISTQSELPHSFRFIKAELEDLDVLSSVFQRESFDVVINLAAQAGVRYSLENPHAYVSSNITGFLNILELSRLHGIKHLVYASSSSVYGLNNEGIFSTNQPVDHPVSLYAATKRSNELMAHVYSNLYKLPVTGLRFFTVYGPWGRPDMAPMIFARSILSGEPISVFNNGDLSRDFTYIDDIVEGIIRTMNLIPTSKNERDLGDSSPAKSNSPFAIYNIGNSQPVKLLDFINILEKSLNKVGEKVYLPMQPGDVYSTYADVTPLMKDTDYKPSTSLDKGIEKFVSWYKSFYKS